MVNYTKIIFNLHGDFTGLYFSKGWWLLIVLEISLQEQVLMEQITRFQGKMQFTTHPLCKNVLFTLLTFYKANNQMFSINQKAK